MGDAELIFLAATAVRTALVFFFLVVGVRWTGKRQTGEMNVHDLLVILILANAVQNAMTSQSPHLSTALVAAGTLILLGWLLAALRGNHPSWEKWLLGAPTVLVENGRLLRSNLRREGVTEVDVMAAVRDQGLPNLAGVKLAVLEIDGSISVIPREAAPGG